MTLTKSTSSSSLMSLTGETSSTESSANTYKKIIYFVRHAEATHNIKEREAIERVKASGSSCKLEQEEARKSVLHCPTLKDAPLSKNGITQSQRSHDKLQDLIQEENSPFQPPQIVLVSPLRRALMTATELFGKLTPRPKFVAIEALREKRTGMECDERSDPLVLEKEFPHVDFTNVKQGLPLVNKGEDNVSVRKRVKTYLENELPHVSQDFVAVVSHKGWLRELRHTLKTLEDTDCITVDFDVHNWHQTLYGNAELRVANFEWSSDTHQLRSVIERSVDNAIITTDIITAQSSKNPILNFVENIVSSIWEKILVPIK